MKKNLNQKLIDLIDYYNLVNINLLLNDKSIKRNSLNMSVSGVGKLQKLEKLKLKIKQIKNCDLKRSATNMVFSDGNIDSKIMIIGEGPGAQEDMEGVPFVGRA